MSGQEVQCPTRGNGDGAGDSPMVLIWVSGSRELGHAPITWEQQFDLRALPVPCSQPWASATCCLCAEHAPCSQPWASAACRLCTEHAPCSKHWLSAECRLCAEHAPCLQSWTDAVCRLCAEHAHQFVSANYLLGKQFCYCLTLKLGK